MRLRILLSYLLISVFTFVGAGCAQRQVTVTNQASITMRLTSPAFQHNEALPRSSTCDGAEVNPPLTIADVPAGVMSLALILNDPDAPSGDFVHWVVWNIPPTTTAIAEHSVPAGAVQGTSGFGSVGYGGPCPPSGTHHYQFKLYALDVALDLPAGSTKAELLTAMSGHIADQATLVGTYQRQL